MFLQVLETLARVHAVFLLRILCPHTTVKR